MKDMSKALQRFLRYAAIDSTSKEGAEKTPSTLGQWTLAELLQDELRDLGAQQVSLDENCYLYGLLPANAEMQPVIALLAHLDTADAVPGRVFRLHVKRFTGDDLPLNEELGIKLSMNDFPALKHQIGKEIVVTDGTTVLGSDDKAGIAEIMTAAEHLIAHPEIRHGNVWLVFTPDEEIGSGADLLQLDLIKADFGYTLDGGALHEIEHENFNAASAHLHLKGRNVHPGYAKGKMLNALKLAIKYQDLLPKDETPEKTEEFEGFFHLRKLSGNEENAEMDYLIREHDSVKFESRKELMQKAAEKMNAEYGEKTVTLTIKDSYRNMKEVIAKHPHVLARAEKAIRACGMEPASVPIRGGTDGARLSFRGLPCPNLGTGGENWHSVYEFLPVDALEKMSDVIIEIVRA
jgi:tripeptide aminopeptidase